MSSCYGPLAARYDALTGDVPYEKMTDWYETAFARSGRAVHTVLDLCCGTGALSLPLARRDSVVTLDFLNEKPYVGITTSWMDALGLQYRHSEDLLRWEIPGRQRIAPFDRTIPADFSTASFPHSW